MSITGSKLGAVRCSGARAPRSPRRVGLSTSQQRHRTQKAADPGWFQLQLLLVSAEVPRNDTCPELPEISNGWRSTSHPELVQGTVVTYQCYPGYQVVGAELLMCQWDLTWSGDLPSCERGGRSSNPMENDTRAQPADGPCSVPTVVSCPDPGQVENGRRVLSGPHFTAGSTVQYICDKGFALSGNSLLSCFNRGASGPRWNQKLPRCLREYELLLEAGTRTQPSPPTATATAASTPSQIKQPPSASV